MAARDRSPCRGSKWQPALPARQQMTAGSTGQYDKKMIFQGCKFEMYGL